jgi:hypothetical protein
VWRKGTGSGTLSIEKDLLRDEGVDYESGDKLVRASRPTDDDTLGEVLPTDDDTLGEVFWWYTTEKLLYSDGSTRTLPERSSPLSGCWQRRPTIC